MGRFHILVKMFAIPTIEAICRYFGRNLDYGTEGPVRKLTTQSLLATVTTWPITSASS